MRIMVSIDMYIMATAWKVSHLIGHMTGSQLESHWQSHVYYHIQVSPFSLAFWFQYFGQLILAKYATWRDWSGASSTWRWFTHLLVPSMSSFHSWHIPIYPRLVRISTHTTLFRPPLSFYSFNIECRLFLHPHPQAWQIGPHLKAIIWAKIIMVS
jgi:hypothetical protein